MPSLPLENLTTAAYDRPPMFLLPRAIAPASLWYFRLEMKFDGEIFDAPQRQRLKRHLLASIEMFDGTTEAVGFNGSCLQLLIGLPAHLMLGDFIARLRILFKSVVRRKLNAGNFVWSEKYQIATVGFAQLNAVGGDIRHRDGAMRGEMTARFELSTID